jgi:putative endonuclease
VPRSHDLGVAGERLAARYLQRIGYTILDRNFRFGHREIDLIVRREDLVAFVEVKTRAGHGYGDPLAAITALKRREVERVARMWQRRFGRPGLFYRFDAVGIVVRKRSEPVITHVPNAWRVGE